MFKKLMGLLDKAVGKISGISGGENYIEKNRTEKEVAKNVGKMITDPGADVRMGITDKKLAYDDFIRQSRVNKENEKKLIHPITKEEVTPLKNVNSDVLSYIKVLSDATYGPQEWPAVARLMFLESSNNPKAFNGTYRGLFQNNKDLFTSDDPSLDEQWNVFKRYIGTHVDRRTGKPYGTPSGALDFRDNEAPKFKASGDPRYAKFSEHWY
jgi:hypothetical protein